MLGAALKFEGKFILQASTDGPVDLLVADYQVPGQLRGYARFSADRVAALGGGDGVSQLLGQGHFAMTIDRGSETERYQGVVPLEGESLTEAADTFIETDAAYQIGVTAFTASVPAGTSLKAWTVNYTAPGGIETPGATRSYGGYGDDGP